MQRIRDGLEVYSGLFPYRIGIDKLAEGVGKSAIRMLRGLSPARLVFADPLSNAFHSSNVLISRVVEFRSAFFPKNYSPDYFDMVFPCGRAATRGRRRSFLRRAEGAAFLKEEALC
jgi:hypothetical protein